MVSASLRREMALTRSKKVWILVLGLPITSCMNSHSQFLCLKNGGRRMDLFIIKSLLAIRYSDL